MMGEIGVRYRYSDVSGIMDYVTRMIEDGRVVAINGESGIHAVLFFAICHDWHPFHEKGSWIYLAHDQLGDTIYLESLVSKGWDKEVRAKFEEIITHKYPNLKQAVWHRWAKDGDREVKIQRRLYV